jgi:hypothetical protein
VELANTLLHNQEEFSRLSLLPEQEGRWLENKIERGWRHLLEKSGLWEEEKEGILDLLQRLRESAGIGTDPEIVSSVSHLPRDLCSAWPRLAYMDFSVQNSEILAEVIELLDHPALDLPHKHQTKKVLTSLKMLVEAMSEIEERANRMILSLRNGDTPPAC